MPRRAKLHRPRKKPGVPPAHPTSGRRESAARRGYGRPWQRLRLEVLAERPLCEDCLDEGRTTPSNEVDHVIPTKGEHDPRHYDKSNLRALCKSHHSRKTQRDKTRGLTR